MFSRDGAEPTLGDDAAVMGVSGDGASALRPFASKRQRPEPPPQAPALAPVDSAAQAVPHPEEERALRKQKKKARKDGDKRRRSQSSRELLLARAKLPPRAKEEARRGCSCFCLAPRTDPAHRPRLLPGTTARAT